MTRAPVRQLDDLNGRFVFVGTKRGHVVSCTDSEIVIRLWSSDGPQRELPDTDLTLERKDPSWRLMYPPKKRSPA